MSALSRLAAALRNLIQRGRRDSDLDAEVESYLALAVDERLAAGDSPEHAGRHARADMGSLTAVTDAVRQDRAGAGLDRLWQDLRYALRMLRRSPGFAAAAILILALGIGANTVMFSVADAALFKPLPYRGGEQLVDIKYLYSAGTPQQRGYVGMSWRQIEFWRTQPSIFSEVLTYRLARAASFADAVTSGPTWVGAVTPALIESFGIHAVRGRTFRPDDLGQPVALVSETFWRRSLAGDAAVIGRTVTIDRRPYTIVGVMPATFSAIVGGPMAVAWLPFDERADRADPSGGYASTILRIRSGLSLAEAERLANAAVAAGGDAATGGTSAPITGASGPISVQLEPGDSRQRSAAETVSMVRILLGVVGFVLLVACANVANLLLGRALARRRELAMRAALGAGRGRLLRQMITEGLVLATLGGIGAVALAEIGVAVLPRVIPWQLRLFQQNPMTIDARVLGACAAAVVVTTLLCALFPALRASRTNLLDAFEGGARVAGAATGAKRARQALQIIEVAATLILITGTTLFAASFAKMATLETGYDLDGLVSTGVSLPAPRYNGPLAQAAFDELVQSVRAMPAIRSATYGHVPPNAMGGSFAFEGHEPDAPGTSPDLTMMYVDPDYFDVLHIRLKAGRAFRSDDVAGGAPVIIVDAVTAARYWPGQSPLGKQVRVGRISPSSATVVGVVDPVKTRYFTSPTGAGELYIPNAQASMRGYRTLVVRAAEDPDMAIAAVQRAVRALDPSLEIKPQRVASYYDELMLTPRFYLVLTSIFAAISLVTAAVGLFALLSYAVAERTREIGVRLALGASLGRIRAMVIRDALVPVAWGLAAGIIGALWLTRYLEGQLFAVTTRDPRSYAIAIGTVVLVAAVAAFLPARRATRIDPIKTLRE